MIPKHGQPNLTIKTGHLGCLSKEHPLPTQLPSGQNFTSASSSSYRAFRGSHSVRLISINWCLMLFKWGGEETVRHFGAGKMCIFS